MTKPFVAVAAARLVRAGRVSFETTLAELVPELGDTPTADAPLVALLSHRAGLEAHLPLFEALRRGVPIERATLVRTAAEARRTDAVGPRPEQGFVPVYSDLGYVLAGIMLEHATFAPLDDIVQDEILPTARARRALGARLDAFD